MMRFQKEDYVGDALGAICDKFLLSFLDPWVLETEDGTLMFPDRFVGDFKLRDKGRLVVKAGDYPVEPESPSGGSVDDALTRAEVLRRISMTSLTSEDSDEGGVSNDLILTVEYESTSKLMRFTTDELVSDGIARAAAKYFVDASLFGFSSVKHGPLEASKPLGEYGFRQRDRLFLQEGAQNAKSGLSLPDVDGPSVLLAFKYNDQDKVLSIKEAYQVKHALELACRKFFIKKPSLYQVTHALHGILDPEATVGSFSFGMREALTLVLGAGAAMSRMSFSEEDDAFFLLTISHEETARSKLMRFAGATSVQVTLEKAAAKMFLTDLDSPFLYSHKHGRLQPELPLSTFAFESREKLLIRATRKSASAAASSSSAAAAATSKIPDVLANAIILVVVHEPTSRIKMVKAEGSDTIADLLTRMGEKFMLDDVWRYWLRSDRLGVLDAEAHLEGLGLATKERLFLAINPDAVEVVPEVVERKESDSMAPGTFYGESALVSPNLVFEDEDEDDAGEEGGESTLLLPGGRKSSRTDRLTLGVMDKTLASSLSPSVLSSMTSMSGMSFEEAFAAEEAAQAEAAAAQSTYEDATSLAAATPAQLFDLIIDAILQNDPNSTVVQDYLLMYRSFLDPAELLQYIMWEIHPPSISPEDALIPLDTRVGFGQKREATKLLFMWLEDYFFDFANDADLSETLRAFSAAHMSAEDAATIDARLDDTLPERSFAALRAKRAVTNTATKFSDWKSLDMTVFAEQLTRAEMELYQAIEAREFLKVGWTREDRATRSPHITALIQKFNEFSRWAVTEIVLPKKAKARAAIIEKFIDCAVALMTLKNFNGVMEIIAALASAEVARLKKTWARVSPEKMDSLSYLQLLMAQEKNYKFLRDQLNSATAPCIPYLGVYLSDLVFTNDGNPNYTEEGLINWMKWRQFAGIIRRMQSWQRGELRIAWDTAIQDYLDNDLVSMDENETYEMSLLREPRKKR